ncbi:MAG: leucine-rich repeat domain-containing protein [Tannerella sp.]|jgi:hypothetical protein|nr:leucine-rich repeat domain-containing protein [Tannerella sp.]
MMDGLVINNGRVEQYTQRESLVVVPEGVVAIGEGAFKGCASIEEIVLPASVMEVGKEAFKGCRKLKKINLPAGITSIGDYAFHRCHSLVNIKLPPSVEKLGDCAFLYCDHLEFISMESVSEMGSSVFLNCTNLRKIAISSVLNEDCINEQFGGCTDVSEIVLDGVAYRIDIFTEGADCPSLIQKIAKDMFSIMDYDRGVLTKYRVNLKDVRIPEGVTEIGKSAFHDRKGVVIIKLPKTLKKISNTAFRNCISLETIEFQSNDVSIEDDAFMGCTTLRQIRTGDGQLYSIHGLPGSTGEGMAEKAVPEIVEDVHVKALKNFYISGTTLVKYRGSEDKVNVPYGITVIGERAFADNENIDCVVLPETVREIRNEAFCDCTSMQKINLPAGIIHIGAATFENCVKLLRIELPDIRKIEQSTFNRCHKLGEVKLPEDLEEIDDLAFYQCHSLKVIDFPASLKSIGKLSFYKTQSIKEVVLPEQIRKAGSNVFTLSGVEKATVCCDLKDSGSDIFSQCRRLKVLTFTEGVTHIPDKIAFNSSNLVYVNLPDSLESIGKNAFEGTAFLTRREQPVVNHIFLDGRGMEGDVVIPNDVIAIAGGAFYGNDKITSVFLPENLKNIGARAFCGCTGLKEITIPPGITEIKEGTFAYCGLLERVTMAGEINNIEDNAFLSCSSLKQLSNLEVESIGDYAFCGCTGLGLPDIKAGRIGKAAFLHTLFFSQQETQSVVSVSDIVVGGSNACGEVIIPSGVKGIAPFAFAGNTTIIAVQLPDTIEYIGNSAFMGCTNLKEIRFQSIPEIGSRAFSKSGVIDISGSVAKLGEQAFAYCKDLEKVNLKRVPVLQKETFTGCDKLSECIFPDLTSIDDYCFTGCKALAGFDFSTVLSIGKHAFEQCFSFREIRLKSDTVVSEYAFSDCCYVEQIVVAGSDFHLGSYAFSGCTSLREIIVADKKYIVESYASLFDKQLPDIVKAIRLSAISCFEIDAPQTITKYWGNASFVKVPDGISRIGEDVFRDCFNLCKVEVPPTVTDIGGRAFLGTGWLSGQQKLSDIVVLNGILIDSNKSIEEICIPDDIRIITEWAFANCFSLKKLTLDTSKVTVKGYAFRNCFNLKEIVTTKDHTLYRFNSLHDMDGDYPPLIRQIFADCQNCFKTDENYKLIESTGNIVDLMLPEGITEIGEHVYAQSNLLTTCTFSSTIQKVGNYAFEKCKWLISVKKMTHVTSIGESAFSGCQRLDSVEVSDRLQQIGKRAFEHCTSLRTIRIPEGVTEIPDKAFYRCCSLKEVILPSTIRRIGTEAFAFCTQLERVDFPDGVKIEQRAFAWCNQLEQAVLERIGNEV